MITRAIGADGTEPELDKKIGEVMPGDRFLLCSDGLCKTLATAEMARLLREDASAEQILSATLAADTSDNVTGVTIYVRL